MNNNGASLSQRMIHVYGATGELIAFAAESACVRPSFAWPEPALALQAADAEAPVRRREGDETS